MESWIRDYVAAQHRALDSVPLERVSAIIAMIRQAWTADQQIFVASNGGNASNASHFATDLGKGASDKLSRRFRILSLSDNTAWITAIGNDYAYEDIFVRQLENFAHARRRPDCRQRERKFTEPGQGVRVGCRARASFGGPGWRQRGAAGGIGRRGDPRERHALRPRRGCPNVTFSA